jgi:hypothetical protein
MSSAKPMNGIESENNPLRIHPRFYQPVDGPRSCSNRRNYPSMHKKSSPVLDTP